ncbi:MAG: hypothetical protein HC903_15805 [Methylacidiphilales bacterium]|nr:hypothetical protein [Candidatus Methylacidiphilales bacterium]NJR19015.1 hypothetical protein [Calothrix sp. CSU_2_0]
MNLRKAIFLITLIIPGLAVVGTSIYWFNRDYTALIAAENRVEKMVATNQPSDRQQEMAYHRALAHRINVFADGTWGLLGGIITAIGIQGLCYLPRETKYK